MSKHIQLLIPCFLLMLLLSGCSSDPYSIDEIREYTMENRDDLLYIATLASGFLTDDYYAVFRDEDGKMKLRTKTYGEYVDMEDYGIDAYDLEDLRDFFEESDISSIALVPDNSILQEQAESPERDATSHIEMHLIDDVHHDVHYTLCFIASDDASGFRNPMEPYDEGGFRERIDNENNSINWVSDGRTDPSKLVKYDASIIKAAEGIWICRQETNFPLYYGFIYG